MANRLLIDPTKAHPGRNEGVVRYVLAISPALVVVSYLIH